MGIFTSIISGLHNCFRLLRLNIFTNFVGAKSLADINKRYKKTKLWKRY